MSSWPAAPVCTTYFFVIFADVFTGPALISKPKKVVSETKMRNFALLVFVFAYSVSNAAVLLPFLLTDRKNSFDFNALCYLTAVIAHIMRQFGRPDSAICAFLDVAVADTGVFGPRLSSSEVCISGTLRN